MTLSTRLSEALRALRWGPGAFAAEAGVSERSAYRWLRGQNEPPERLVRWAEELAEFHAANPPPQIPDDA